LNATNTPNGAKVIHTPLGKTRYKLLIYNMYCGCHRMATWILEPNNFQHLVAGRSWPAIFACPCPGALRKIRPFYGFPASVIMSIATWLARENSSVQANVSPCEMARLKASIINWY